MTRNMNFENDQQIADYIRPKISKTQEEIWVLALDSQIQMLGERLLFRGTVDQCSFHARDLFHCLVSHNAHQYVLVHNHISDNCFPSPEDLLMTKKIVAMSQVFEILLLDHLILSNTGFYSFKKDGLLEKFYHNKNYLRNFRS